LKLFLIIPTYIFIILVYSVNKSEIIIIVPIFSKLI
jgi:hypothetical protein